MDSCIEREDDARIECRTTEGISRPFRKSRVAEGIFIEDVYHRPSFFDEVESALSTIAQGKSGKQLIKIIQKHTPTDKHILIRYGVSEANTGVLLTESQRERFGPATPVEEKKRAISLAVKSGPGKNEGTSAEIIFDPDFSADIDKDGRPLPGRNPRKSWLVLCHELIHAMRMLKGTSTAYLGDKNDPKTGAGYEELRAVSLGKKKTPSENSVREEHNEPLRKYYQCAG
ncbi:TPA: M91 family zinc metallopeptidase [Enterobacter bugandensis]